MSGIADLVLPVLVNPPDLEVDERYREAEKFKQEIQPEKEVNYDWVWDYASETHNRIWEGYKELDNKANDIIKYLGGGVGLFTVGTIANISSQNVWLVLWAIPSFVVSLVSIFFAVLARQPNPVKLPPTVESAYKYANSYKETGKANFLGQWHLVITGMDVAAKRKSDQVRLATWMFFGTIVLLGLPLFRAIAHFGYAV